MAVDLRRGGRADGKKNVMTKKRSTITAWNKNNEVSLWSDVELIDDVNGVEPLQYGELRNWNDRQT